MIKRFMREYLRFAPRLMAEWFAQTILGGVDGPIGMLLRRYCYLSFIGKTKGRFFIWSRVSIQHGYGLSIGSDVCINSGCVLDARGVLSIGDRSLIGPNCTIVSSTHRIDSHPISDAGHEKAPTVIESDVWIGANVVILGGIRVAHGCVIGAGSIVTKSTTPYGIYVGNPARLIRMREAL